MRAMDTLFGPFFRWFNGWFGRRSEGYGRGVTGIVQAQVAGDDRLRGAARA